MEEVQDAISRLKVGKASGVDEIIVEWFKYGGDNMTYAIWLVVDRAWSSEVSPQDWKDGIICPIYKEGDKRDSEL